MVLKYLVSFILTACATNVIMAAPSSNITDFINFRRQDISLPTDVTSVVTLTSAQQALLTPYVAFASQCYCPAMIHGTACGIACTKNSGFELTANGGDGQVTQIWYVGYWPKKNAVIVAHQGTESIPGWMADADAALVTADSLLYPGLGSGIMFHQGFYGEQTRSAKQVLAEVQRLISARGASRVICTGHSLGAAIAELDTLFLRLNLPSSIQVTGVTFGTPRVGNAAYANFFDSKLKGNYFHVAHGSDPVANVPPMFLGYRHPTGEIHLLETGGAVACPGQESSAVQCTDAGGLMINAMDHIGPYNGAYMGCY